MKNLKKPILGLIIFLLLFSINLSLITISSATNIVDDMIKSINAVNLPTAGNTKTEIDTGTEEIVGKIIQAFLSIFGILFFALMVYGGYKWMIAQGREEEVQKAKDIIKTSIIGLGIVLAAYAIALFVTTQFWQAAQGPKP